MKASKVIEYLSFEYPEARKLLKDQSFLESLQEELDIFLQNTHDPKSCAIFEISESGEIVFNTLQSTCAREPLISVSLEEILLDEQRQKSVMESFKTADRDKILIEQIVKEDDSSIVAKENLKEKFKELINIVNEVEVLIDNLKINTVKPLVEQAKSIVDYDIAIKKQELLNKLLKNNNNAEVK